MKLVADADRWRPYKLGNVLRRHKEIVHPGDGKTGEVVFVGLEHIESNTGRRLGASTIDLGRMTGRKPTFRAGQIVYGYLRPYLNKVWVAEFDGCCSVDQFAFDVRTDLADTQYVAAFMRSETFLSRAAAATTTGQFPRISVDEIAAVEVELPPLAEQKRIAVELTAAMAAVERAHQAAEDRLAAAEALPEAYLREVFEGPAASEWETTTIGEVAPVQTGFAFKSEWFADVGVRILRNVNIHQGFIEWDEVVFVRTTLLDRFSGFALNSGDTVLTLDRPIVANGLKAARLAPTDLPAMLNQRIARFKLDSGRIDPNFFYAFLRSPSFVESIRGHDQSLGVPHISPDQVEGVELRVPPLVEQQRIIGELSSRLAAAEVLIARCREELAVIEALPAALLRQVFTETD